MEVVDPRAQGESPHLPIPERVPSTGDLNLVVIDNSKPNFDRFAGKLVELVHQRFEPGVVEVIRKESPSMGVTQADLFVLRPEFGIVLAGSGD